MKFIHTADVHLGSRLESNLVGEQAARRRREIQTTFENIVNYAAENGVKNILICGDLFDTSAVSRKLKNEIVSLFRANPGIDFYYLRGNHDETGADLLAELPENVKTFGDTWTYYDLGDVCIAGCEDIDRPGLYTELALDPARTNIVMLHGQTVTGKAQSGCISLKNLRGLGVDYLALGHIHGFSEQKIDAKGVAVYCGCPDGRGFDETGEKGFILLDAGEKKVGYEFVPTSSRRIFEKYVDISGISSQRELENAVISAAKECSPDDMVKFILTGTYPSDLHKDIGYLTSKLSEVLFFAKIYDQTHLDLGGEALSDGISLCGEFIRLAREAKMSDEERELTVGYGIRALKGEEFD